MISFQKSLISRVIFLSIFFYSKDNTISRTLNFKQSYEQERDTFSIINLHSSVFTCCPFSLLVTYMFHKEQESFPPTVVCLAIDYNFETLQPIQSRQENYEVIQNIFTAIKQKKSFQLSSLYIFHFDSFFMPSQRQKLCGRLCQPIQDSPERQKMGKPYVTVVSCSGSTNECTSNVSPSCRQALEQLWERVGMHACWITKFMTYF